MQITKKGSAIGATDLVGYIADHNSFDAWDEDVVSTDPLCFVDSRTYADRLAKARRDSGHSESVLTGRGLLSGRPVVLVVGDFRFLAGSVGIAAAERIVRAFERAAAGHLPVVAITASGGTRLQEGAPALVQMIRVAQAVREYRMQGNPYVVYLTNPTMGGALASWGSLGQLTFAQPGALVGFSGPRVAAMTGGRALPDGIQETENLLRCGLIDDVFPPEELRERIKRLLAVLDSRKRSRRTTGNDLEPPPMSAVVVDPWSSVQLSRDARRPGVRDLLDACAENVTYLRGDRAGGGDDPCCVTAIARIAGIAAMVVGQDRAASPAGARMTPAGFRKALRAMRTAAELRLPLVTVIDSPGAELSVEAEEGGLSSEIASCLHVMSGLATPTLSVLLGEGGGGGALALFPADRVVAAQHGWLAPIAPEGASAIVYRSPDRAAEIARSQGLASWELSQLGIIDRIVAEKPDAARERDRFLRRISAVLGEELGALFEQSDAERLARRARRYRELGISLAHRPTS
jgi:acetyl-CoA carboxylase carboxyl transferase beta subunit